MNASDDWIAEARRLRNDGWNWALIAREISVEVGRLRRHLDEDYRIKTNAQKSAAIKKEIAFNQLERPRCRLTPDARRLRPKAGILQPHIMAAARAFASGEIDRRELSLRLRFSEGGDDAKT